MNPSPLSGTSETVKIALAGDSTVADYASDRPLRGWGQMLGAYFNVGRVTILNHAVNGRSSKSFIHEQWWQKLLAEKPNYVLIQFGHNDNAGKGADRATLTDPVPTNLPAEGLGSDPTDWYRHNLRTYIEQARAIGAVPIIVTPMERRLFDERSGRVRTINRPWGEAAAAVAEQMQALCIDLNTYSVELMNRSGPVAIKRMHPSVDGRTDDTHFNETGARVYAEHVVEQLRERVPDLRPLIRLPDRRTVDEVLQGVDVPGV